MDKAENTKSRLTLWKHTLTLSLIISILVFLGFRPLFELTPSGISKEILVAGIGALFVTLITLILLERQAETQKDLLRQQYEAQEKQKQSEYLYTRKIDQYNQAMQKLHMILGNGAVSIQDLDEGQFALSNLQLFGNVDACKSYQRVVEKMVEIHTDEQDSGDNSRHLDEGEKKDLFNLICAFTNACRIDMGLEEIPYQETMNLLRIEEQIEEKKLAARQPLQGGLAEFAKSHKLSEEKESSLKRLIDVLKSEVGVVEKYTRSEISIAVQISATKTKNIAYLKPQKERLRIAVPWPETLVCDTKQREDYFERLRKNSIEVESTMRKGKPSYPMGVSWNQMKEVDWHILLVEAMEVCKKGMSES